MMKKRFVLSLILFVMTRASSAQISVQPGMENAIFEAVKGAVVGVQSGGSSGTGFLISREGLILTNDHVVEDTTQLRIHLNDALAVQAVMVERTPQFDLAVLRIHPDYAGRMPELKLALDGVDPVRVGDLVLAIGNPLGFERVLSKGMICRIDEEVILSDINTDHGSSGGPVFNYNQEVIGISSLIIVDGGQGFTGIIPIAVAKPLIKSVLDKSGHFRLPSPEQLPAKSKDIYPLWAVKYSYIDNTDDASYLTKAMIGGERGYKPKNPNSSPKTPYSFRIGKEKIDIRIFTPPAHFKFVWYMRNRKLMYMGPYYSPVYLAPRPDFEDTYENRLKWRENNDILQPNVIFQIGEEDVSSIKSFTLNIGNKIVRPIAGDLKNGRFTYSSSDFAPAQGQWNKMSIAIVLDDSDEINVGEIPPVAIEQIWFDLSALREQLEFDQIPLRNVH